MQMQMSLVNLLPSSGVMGIGMRRATLGCCVGTGATRLQGDQYIIQLGYDDVAAETHSRLASEAPCREHRAAVSLLDDALSELRKRSVDMGIERGTVGCVRKATQNQLL